QILCLPIPRAAPWAVGLRPFEPQILRQPIPIRLVPVSGAGANDSVALDPLRQVAGQGRGRRARGVRRPAGGQGAGGQVRFGGQQSADGRGERRDGRVVRGGDVVGAVGGQLDQQLPRGGVVARPGQQPAAAVRLVRGGVPVHFDQNVHERRQLTQG